MIIRDQGHARFLPKEMTDDEKQVSGSVYLKAFLKTLPGHDAAGEPFIFSRAFLAEYTLSAA